MKKCLGCNQTKPPQEWNKCLSKRDGLSTQCRECQKKRYYKNKEKNLLQKRQYYIANVDRMRLKGREKYRNNKEKIIETIKKYRKNNKEKIRNNAKNKYNSDINYRLKVRLRVRLGHFIKNRSKTGILLKYFGLSREDYIKYLELKFIDGMTWENYGHGDGKWCIDHVIPLCHFNFENEEHVALASHYTNTQPMWFKENGIAGAKNNWVEKEDFVSWAKEILNKNIFDTHKK